MTSGITHHELYRSDSLYVVDVCCRIHRSGVGSEESVRSCSIVLPRLGCYTRHLGNRTEFANARSVLFFRGDESYRFSHPVAGGDDSTVLQFPDHILDEAFHPSPRGLDSFPSTQCEIGVEQNRQLQILRHRARTGGTSLEIEETAMALLHAIAAAASGKRHVLKSRVRARTRQRQQALVDRARALLHENLGSPVSLAGVSHSVGSSPYHLTRLFRTFTGQPMYRYLTDLRMTVALDGLASGESDLTRLAGKLGYSSHSHFTDTFRRHFGCPPSQFRLNPSRSEN